MNSKRQRWVPAGALLAATVVVSIFHYATPTTHVWLHPLLQRGYYIPILVAALWFGWRWGLFAAGISGLLYIPHILMAWGSHPEYMATQYVEIGMFFVIGTLTGILADHERAQRKKVEETARQLSEVYAQLQASFEQLRRADRLSALGELSAGLAHEIRNPLGAIEGTMQILRRPNISEATRDEFWQVAEQEVNRLKGLVSNFLEFARPQPPRRVATEPFALLDSVAKLASETAKMAKAQIRVQEASDVPGIAVDPEQMKQVLLNLVINAVQAMPNGGEVVLRAVHQAGTLALEVQDTGIGIAAEDLERIFDPFFTTRADGTGLGLSIAYQIVNQHGGHISARRNPSGGMTFAVALPIAEAPVAEAEVQRDRR
jgi:two-component system sensor histidine kinase HydH